MNYKFSKIELECFRGYKEKQIFDFTLESGIANLNVIYAPNGFGKTSFFDAIEWGFSGKISRLNSNKKVKDVADEEKGYIIKNRECGEFATISFAFEKKMTPIVINSKKIIGARKRDDDEGDITSGNELFQTLNGQRFVKKNVLTHDQVDTFLRFTSSKEKYNALQSFWDANNDTEVYKNIIIILKELEKKSEFYANELLKLNRELITLAPSENLLGHINSLISEFEDSNLKLVSTELNVEQLDKYIIEWNHKKTVLKQTEHNLEKRRSSINNLLNNYDNNYIQAMDKLEKSIYNKTVYDNLLKKFQRKEILNSEIISIEESMKNLNNKFFDYQFIVNNVENYKVLSDNLLRLEIKELELNQLLVKYTNEISEHSEQNKDINNLLDDINQKLIVSSSNSEQINEVISQLKFLNKDLHYNKRIKQVRNITKYLEDEVQKINYLLSKNTKYLQMDIRELINLRIEDELRFEVREKYEDCKDIQKSIIEKEELLKKTKNNLVMFEEMSSSLENLARLGTQIVLESKVTNCPLCKYPYSDFNQLLDKIQASSDIYNLDEFSKDIILLETTIVEHETSLSNLSKELYADLETDWNSLKYKKSIYEKRLMFFNSKNLIYSQRLSEVLKINENIDKLLSENNILNTRDENEILIECLRIQKSVSDSLFLDINKYNDFQNEKRKIEKNLSEINNEVDHVRILIEQNRLLVSDITENNVYKIMNERMSYNNFNIDNIKELIEDINKDIALQSNKIKTINVEILELDSSLVNHNQDEIISEFRSSENEIEKNTVILDQYKSEYLKFIDGSNMSKNEIIEQLSKVNSSIEYTNKRINTVVEILSNVETIINNNSWNQKKVELEKLQNNVELNNNLKNDITSLRDLGKKHIEEKITKRLNLETINKVYQMIDPHPIMKHISIELDDSDENQLGLNIYTINIEKNAREAPILYFSSAQVNMLSISIFLAGALEEQGEINTIFMDDPIQHLDGINLLSFIDLLRIITTQLDRQVVISTHDERFYKLVSRKIDPQYFNSKFIELGTFGRLK